jgi:hypothetical protein
MSLKTKKTLMQNRIAEDYITPKVRQPEQHIA